MHETKLIIIIQMIHILLGSLIIPGRNFSHLMKLIGGSEENKNHKHTEPNAYII